MRRTNDISLTPVLYVSLKTAWCSCRTGAFVSPVRKRELFERSLPDRGQYISSMLMNGAHGRAAPRIRETSPSRICSVRAQEPKSCPGAVRKLSCRVESDRLKRRSSSRLQGVTGVSLIADLAYYVVAYKLRQERKQRVPHCMPRHSWRMLAKFSAECDGPRTKGAVSKGEDCRR